MKKSKLLVFVIIFISIHPSFAEEDSVKYEIKRIITKAIIDNISKAYCQTTVSTASSMVIIFSKKGDVENIMLSADIGCLSHDEVRITNDIKRRIRDLNKKIKDKHLFSNKYILAVITVDVLANKPDENVLRSSWNKIFDGIDEQMLDGRH